MPQSSWKNVLNLTVIVAALGYFVDIFDLVLFPIVRIPSLLSLGVPAGDIDRVFALLNATQMIGMLLGGIFWGVLGDKKGRLSVLFGSITLYSLANIANAFVPNIPAFYLLRFVAGFGLAGELGVAITLVSEVLPKETRGIGTAIVASVGVTGAVVAALVGNELPWRWAFGVGGVLGLLLLLLRIKVTDSGMFERMQHTQVSQGNFFMLFQSRERFLRYMRCIFVGLPIWYVVGVLVHFSPTIAKASGVTGVIVPGTAIACCYAGLAVGDFGSGIISQWLKSRRRAIALFQGLAAVGVVAVLSLRGLSPMAYYILCVYLGIAGGYWAVFVTVASEQFGTNLRATVTTTAPNFVRGFVAILQPAFVFLSFRIGVVASAASLGIIALTLGGLSLVGMRETHGRDLDFTE
ncbi:MAG: MFS transporter [Holophaga sp.]|nr:MFS transporter [Holophaga sp.]